MHFVIKGLRDLFLQTPEASLQRRSDILLLGSHHLSQVSILNVLLQAADAYDSDTKSLTQMISAQTQTGVLKVFAQDFLAQNYSVSRLCFKSLFFCDSILGVR